MQCLRTLKAVVIWIANKINLLSPHVILSGWERHSTLNPQSGVTMSPVRFQYITTRRRRYPVIVAYQTQEESGQILITMGASFCHESDRFSRPLGREIAEGRMHHSPFRFWINFDRTQNSAYGKTVSEGLRNFVESHDHLISVTYSRGKKD
jgi:hypothetical protein